MKSILISIAVIFSFSAHAGFPGFVGGPVVVPNCFAAADAKAKELFETQQTMVLTTQVQNFQLNDAPENWEVFKVLVTGPSPFQVTPQPQVQPKPKGKPNPLGIPGTIIAPPNTTPMPPINLTETYYFIMDYDSATETCSYFAGIQHL